MDFALRPGFAAQLFYQQRGRCAVSGIAFTLERFHDALVKHPFAPSIDRRLSSGGYTEDNVRLVCVAVNFGMGQWGEEVFMTLARGAVEREGEVTNSASVPDTAAQWEAELKDRIDAAEKILPLLPLAGQEWQRHHIAGLKSALSKGLKRATQAGVNAAITRKQRRPPRTSTQCDIP